MRWPIQFQLLLPMLTVVCLAIALASAVSAYFGGRLAHQAQEDNLRRVVATLTEARFPPSDPVLRLVSGFSGAEFVLFDQQGALQASTLPLAPDDLRRLRDMRNDDPSHGLSGQPTTLVAGRSYLSQRVSVPGRDPVVRAGSLVVLYPEDLWAAVMRQAAYPALIAGAVATLAIVAVATVLAHRLVRPIRQLGDQAAAIARGDFRPMAFSRHNDEIRDLAVSINRMSEQLGHYEVQVRRHEQLRTLDRLGAGMAHQLRNAATGGRMAIELHQRECAAGAGNESLEVALRQLRLMESYLRRFMVQGRDQPLVTEDVSLATVVEDALSLLRPACVHAGIELEFHPPAEPLVVQTFGSPPAHHRRLEARRRASGRDLRPRHGPWPFARGGRAPLRALRQRQARRDWPGAVRRSPGGRGASRLRPLAAREQHHLFHRRTSPDP
jgi:signal transduction histidine kinase